MKLSSYSPLLLPLLEFKCGNRPFCCSAQWDTYKSVHLPALNLSILFWVPCLQSSVSHSEDSVRVVLKNGTGLHRECYIISVWCFKTSCSCSRSEKTGVLLQTRQLSCEINDSSIGQLCLFTVQKLGQKMKHVFVLIQLISKSVGMSCSITSISIEMRLIFRVILSTLQYLDNVSINVVEWASKNHRSDSNKLYQSILPCFKSNQLCFALKSLGHFPVGICQLEIF